MRRFLLRTYALMRRFFLGMYMLTRTLLLRVYALWDIILFVGIGLVLGHWGVSKLVREAPVVVPRLADHPELLRVAEFVLLFILALVVARYSAALRLGLNRIFAGSQIAHLYSRLMLEVDGILTRLFVLRGQRLLSGARQASRATDGEIGEYREHLAQVLIRAEDELRHRVQRSVVDNFITKLEGQSDVKIIATSASPLSIWFNHVIITYFIAQISAIYSKKIQSFKRYYFLDELLVGPIQTSRGLIFDYFEAAKTIHKIGRKGLVLVWPGSSLFDFPTIEDNSDDKSFIVMFDANDKPLLAMSFRYEEGWHHFVNVDEEEYGLFVTGQLLSAVAKDGTTLVGDDQTKRVSFLRQLRTNSSALHTWKVL